MQFDGLQVTHYSCGFWIVEVTDENHLVVARYLCSPLACTLAPKHTNKARLVVVLLSSIASVLGRSAES